jgi:hypothetical protein
LKGAANLINLLLYLETEKKIVMDDLKRLLLKLPQQNYDILKYLMHHLNKYVSSFRPSQKPPTKPFLVFPFRVQAQCAVNKMKSDNLAALFGPNLMRAKAEKDSDLNAQMEVMKLMIVEYDTVFE